MFYSSEASNGTSTIQPKANHICLLKNCANTLMVITLKVSADTISISQNTSLSRNIHFPLRCDRNSAIFASLMVTHLARQDKHQCILPNISILSTTGVLQVFSSLLKHLSHFHAQKDLAILSQQNNVVIEWKNLFLYERKTPFPQAFSSPQLPCLLQKSQIFLQRGETRPQSPGAAPFGSLPSTQRQPDCSTHAYMSTLDWDISWSPMR